MDVNEDTLSAIWCIDSETSEEVLIDRKTNQIIARRDKNGKILPC